MANRERIDVRTRMNAVGLVVADLERSLDFYCHKMGMQQVADLAASERFYVGVLGFDLVQRFAGQALFVSAGGYHHHLGLNVWAGVGAPPGEDSTRLRWAEIVVPDATALEAVQRRLDRVEVPAESGPTGLFVNDPSANGLWLRCAESDPR